MAKQLTTKIVFAGSAAGLFNTIKGVQKRINGLQRTTRNFGRNMTSGGLNLGATVTAPLTFATRGIIESQKKLEEATNELSRRTGVTGAKPMKQVTDQADKLAKRLPVLTKDIVHMRTELMAAGLGFEESRAILKNVAEGAVATDIDGRRFADQITNATLSFYGATKGAEQWQERTKAITENMLLASMTSNTDASKAFDALLQWGPIARQLNIPLEQTSALIATAADNSWKASEAGRAFRTGFIRSLMLTPKAMRMLKQEGINFSDWLQLDEAKMSGDRFLDYVGSIAPGIQKHSGMINKFLSQDTASIVEGLGGFTSELVDRMDLKPADAAKLEKRIAEWVGNSAKSLDPGKLFGALKGVSPALQKEIFSMFHASKFASFVADGGKGFTDKIEQMREKEAQILQKMNKFTGKKYTSVAEYAAAQEMKGLPGALLMIQNAADRFKRGIFTAFDYEDELGGRENKITDFIFKISEKLNGLKDNMNSLKVRFAVIGAAIVAALSPALIYLGFMTQGLAALLGPLKLLTAPLGMAARGMSLLAIGMLGTGKAGRGALKALLRFGVVGAVVGGAAYVIKEAWGKLPDVFNKDMVAGFNTAKAALYRFVQGDWKGGLMFAERSLDAFKSAFKTGWATVKDTFLSFDWSPGFVKLGNSLSDFGTTVKDFFIDLLPEDAKASIDTLKDFLGFVADKAANAGSTVLDTVTNGIKGLRDVINGWKESGKFDEVTDSVQRVVAGLGDSIDKMVNVLAGFNSADGSAFKEFLIGLGNSTMKGVSTILNTIANAIERINRAIDDFNAAKAEGFGSGMKGLWDGMSTEEKIVGGVAGGGLAALLTKRIHNAFKGLNLNQILDKALGAAGKLGKTLIRHKWKTLLLIAAGIGSLGIELDKFSVIDWAVIAAGIAGTVVAFKKLRAAVAPAAGAGKVNGRKDKKRTVANDNKNETTKRRSRRGASKVGEIKQPKNLLRKLKGFKIPGLGAALLALDAALGTWDEYTLRKRGKETSHGPDPNALPESFWRKAEEPVQQIITSTEPVRNAVSNVANNNLLPVDDGLRRAAESAERMAVAVERASNVVPIREKVGKAAAVLGSGMPTPSAGSQFAADPQDPRAFPVEGDRMPSSMMPQMIGDIKQVGAQSNALQQEQNAMTADTNAKLDALVNYAASLPGMPAEIAAGIRGAVAQAAGNRASSANGAPVAPQPIASTGKNVVS